MLLTIGIIISILIQAKVAYWIYIIHEIDKASEPYRIKKAVPPIPWEHYTEAENAVESLINILGIKLQSDE